MDLVQFYAAHVAAEAEDFRFRALKDLLAGRMQERSLADIGCGTGMLTREFAREGYRALAVEPDPRIFAIAQRVRADSGAEYRLLNSWIPDLSPDTLAPYRNFLLNDVLEHVEDDRALLRELHARMPEGAKLLCLLPALESLYGERDRAVGHHRRYSQRRARELFSGVPFRGATYSCWNLLGVPAYWFFEKVLGRCVPEGFRQGRRSLPSRLLNGALGLWFRWVENRVRFPAGLSLLVEAVK